MRPHVCGDECTYECTNVCMYVCMYVRMYVRMYVWYVCMYECIYVCTYVCIYTQVYVCMHVCTHVRMYVKHVCVTIIKVQWFSSCFCQSCEFRAQKGEINEKSTLAGVAFTRHFLVLVCIFPLLHLTGFTLQEIYATFWAGDFVTITTKYIICMQTTDGSECVWLGNNTGFVVLTFVAPICAALFAILLLVYSLFPRVARELWLSHISKLRRLLCCK